MTEDFTFYQSKYRKLPGPPELPPETAERKKSPSALSRQTMTKVHVHGQKEQFGGQSWLFSRCSLVSVMRETAHLSVEFGERCIECYAVVKRESASPEAAVNEWLGQIDP